MNYTYSMYIHIYIYVCSRGSVRILCSTATTMSLRSVCLVRHGDVAAFTVLPSPVIMCSVKCSEREWVLWTCHTYAAGLYAFYNRRILRRLILALNGRYRSLKVFIFCIYIYIIYVRESTGPLPCFGPMHSSILWMVVIHFVSVLSRSSEMRVSFFTNSSLFAMILSKTTFRWRKPVGCK